MRGVLRGEEVASTLSIGRRLGAYFDLTRMSYFGAPVAAVFLFGTLVGFGVTGQFDWVVLVKVLFGGLLGTSAGFVLNDMADRRHDRVIYGEAVPDELYLRQIRMERPFTKARPLAAGILSPIEAGVLCAVLAGLAAVIALTFPPPRNYWILAILGYNFVGEPGYCWVKQRQMRFPLATFITGSLIGLWPVAGYAGAALPDRVAFLLFLVIFFWETGHNQVYDIVDYENDRRRGLNVMTVLYGLKAVSTWVFVLGILLCASVVALWRVADFSPVFLAVAGAGLALFTAMNVRLLLKPSVKRGVPAEQVALLLICFLFLASLSELVFQFATRR